MKFRNAIFNQYGSIDCEINDPRFGWIPFTASPDDPCPIGPEIFAAAKSTADPYIPPPSQPLPTSEEILERERVEVRTNRATAFKSEADPLFFKWQAGESTKEKWEAKREEIRQRFPYPEV